VLVQGPVSPEQLLLVGTHRWVPQDDVHLAVWKLAQLLTDHPVVSAKLFKGDLTHLVIHYCFDVISQAVAEQKEEPYSLASYRTLLCLDDGKANEAFKELMGILPTDEGE
jgi:hypothetical protein